MKNDGTAIMNVMMIEIAGAFSVEESFVRRRKCSTACSILSSTKKKSTEITEAIGYPVSQAEPSSPVAAGSMITNESARNMPAVNASAPGYERTAPMLLPNSGA